MALTRLTKITGPGIATDTNWVGDNANYTGIVTATKFVGSIEGSIAATDATFSGNVSIGGTLTYEDVTNIDSVGLITARDGIKVGSGVTIEPNGQANFAGITTVSGTDLVIKPPTVSTSRIKLGYNEQMKIYVSNANQNVIQSTAAYLQIASNNLNLSRADTNLHMARFLAGQQCKLTYNYIDRIATSGVGATVYGQLDTTDLTIAGVSTFTNGAGVGDFKPIQLEKSATSGATRIQFLENGTNKGGITYSHDNNRIEIQTESSGGIRFQDVSNNQFALINGSAITSNVNLVVNRDLDVDGHTNLDNVSIVGIATVSGSSQINFGGGTTQLQISNSNDSDINHNESNGSGLRFRINGQTQMVIKTDSITYGTNLHNYYTNRIATHSGDTDTNIRFPSNDQISFETGGSERGRFDNDGNFLVGTTGHGNAGAGARKLVLSGPSNVGLTINSTTTSGIYRDCNIYFGYGTSTNDMAKGQITYSGNGDYFHMSVGNTAYTLAKSFRLNGNGTVRFDSTHNDAHSQSLVIKSHKARALNDNNGIVFRDANDHTQAVINVTKMSTSDATSDLVFRTSSGQVVNTLQGIPERMRIKSDGHVLPAITNTQDLGSSSKRWRNVYTTDLQLSNEGKTNDVDGTWGNYTIQEGESDLFLINNRNGKKYVFLLKEVS